MRNRFLALTDMTVRRRLPSLGHRTMRFGNIEIDPAVNPAILDTVTWDPRTGVANCRLRGSRRIGSRSAGLLVGPTSRAGPCILHGLSRLLCPARAAACTSWLGCPTVSMSCDWPSTRTPGCLGDPLHVMPLDDGCASGSVRRRCRCDSPLSSARCDRTKGPGRWGPCPAGDRHADVHVGLAGDLAGDGRGRIRGQRHPELRAGAEPAGGCAGGPAAAEQLPVRLRDARRRTHRQHVRGALGGRRDRGAEDRDTPAVRGGCGPYHHPARPGRARARQAHHRRGPRLHVFHT